MSALRVAFIASLLLFSPTAASVALAQGPLELAGTWRLDREASQFPREVGFGATFAAAGPLGRGAGGVDGGGGGAGRLPDPRALGQSSEDASRIRFLTDEVRTPYERLTLTVTPAAVTIAPDRAAPRTFRPGRRDEEVMLGSATGVATATWDGARLVIVYKADAARSVRYTYALNPSPRQLIVDVEFVERGGGDTVRRVYGPAPAVDTLAAPPAAAPSAANAPLPAVSPLRSATPQGVPASPTAADAAPTDQRPEAALRGVTRVGVVVEGIGADAEKCGLQQDALESAVSKRLTDAGFRVARNSDEDTYLYVNVNTATLSAGLCVSRYDVTLYSHTTARLSHTVSPVLLQAELLRTGGMAGGSAAAHADGVTKGVIEAAEQFAQQMRNANLPR